MATARIANRMTRTHPQAFMRATLPQVALACLVAVAMWLIPPVLMSPAQADWQQIPGTKLIDARPTMPNLLSMWVSLAFERETGTICLWRAGGDGDYGKGDSYCAKLGATPGTASPWIMVEPPQVNATGVCPSRPPYGPAGNHTYDTSFSIGGGKWIWAGPTEFLIPGQSGVTCGNRKSVWLVEYTYDGPAPVWTELTNPENIAVLASSGRSEFKDGKIYSVGLRSGVLDTAGQLLAGNTVQFQGVIINGVTQPFVSGFSTGLGAAGINDDNLMCLAGDTGPSGGPFQYYIQCSQIDGVRE